MKEGIYAVNDDGSLDLMGDLERPRRGNVKTALFGWMKINAVVEGRYVVLGRLTEVYEAKKQEKLKFEPVTLSYEQAALEDGTRL